MKSRSKFPVRFLLGLLFVGALAAIIVAQKQVSRLRLENHSLESDNQEHQRLIRENQEIPGLRATAEEAQRLLQENRDLPKLRNDIQQLRWRMSELQKLRTENLRLIVALTNEPTRSSSQPPPPDFVAKAALKDAGLGSPEAVWQTALWTILQGDTNRFSECFVESGEDGHDSNGVSTMKRVAAALGGFRSADKPTYSRGVQIYMEIYPSGELQSVVMTKVGGEWKIGGNPWGN